MRFSINGIELEEFVPLVDGVPDATARMEVQDEDDHTVLTVVLPRGGRIASIGLRLTARGVRKYLRSGYTSWDGSVFVDPGALSDGADPKLTSGYAMTALLPPEPGAVVLGFLRHDRFQSRLTFRAGAELGIDIETLVDQVPHDDEIRSEPLALFGGAEVEATLRRWASLVAAASPAPPRVPPRRLTGWCSWYNLYSSLSEPVLREHLAAARAFRDSSGAPFDIFLIDDGFTPEMGDWLEFKPAFPHGMRPLIEEIRAAGFMPGLWIAPFMVGNRSRLYTEHPDWVVQRRRNGAPLPAMTFYGEFRWHKRSEEYYVLDVTHPEAEAYIRMVFRTWRRDWGCDYFKTDFMHLGSMFGPDEARWYEEGHSRIAVWMKMARLIREEIGEDALWLCCGAPLLPPVGLCDAMRIGRDVGPKWSGDQSAQALLRDQTTRNFMHGILWQADPDCILLRDRFHELSDDQVDSLAWFAGLAGGVLMTSDHLGEVPRARRELLAELAGDGRAFRCDFPALGDERVGVLVQRVTRPDGTIVLNVFNTTGQQMERDVDGSRVMLPPYGSRRVIIPPHGGL